jgi:hypothetical protein
MAQSTAPRLRFQVFQLRCRPVAQPELGLDTILPEATVQQVLKEEGASWRRVFSTPWLTFWAFSWQALSPDHSCRAAVKRIAAWLGRPGADDRRRGYRPVLQGPGALARIGPVPLDAMGAIAPVPAIMRPLGPFPAL